MNQSHPPIACDACRSEQHRSPASTGTSEPKAETLSAEPQPHGPAAHREEATRLASLQKGLLAHAESLVVISTAHLHPDTRKRLADGALSVLAYANDYGGFIYVGEPRENEPTEPELAALFETARSAGIVWLKVDCDGPVVDGLPTFDDPPWD